MLVKAASLKMFSVIMVVILIFSLIDPEAMNRHLFPEPGIALLLSFFN